MEFSVNAQRRDPYKNFKFRVKWDGRYVAGVSKVSALKRMTEVLAETPSFRNLADSGDYNISIAAIAQTLIVVGANAGKPAVGGGLPDLRGAAGPGLAGQRQAVAGLAP